MIWLIQIYFSILHGQMHGQMELVYRPSTRFKLVKKIVDKHGKHPIKLRLTYLRKNFDRALGLSAEESCWDTEKERFRGKGRSKDNILLDAIEQKAGAVILREVASGNDIIPMNLLNEILGHNNCVKSDFVYDFFDETIGSLKSAGQLKTAESFNYAKQQLKKFYPKGNLTFDQITYSFLEKFRVHLTGTHSVNGISVVLRSVRSLYNKALNHGRFKEKEYPWKKLRIKSQPTAKRAISKEQMQQIAQLELEYGSRLWHSRNYFLLSYLAQGINFKDLAELSWTKNVFNDKLVYRRSKTGGMFTISINEKMRGILAHYKNVSLSNGEYLFPILKDGLNATQKVNRLKKCLAQVNKDIKAMGELAKIENHTSLSFYVARHSFATTLKKLGYSTTLISEAMGHADERTTQIYLASFDTSLFDEANMHLL